MLSTVDEGEEATDDPLEGGSSASGPPRHMLGSMLELEQVFSRQEQERVQQELKRKRFQQGASRSVIMISRAKQADRVLMGTRHSMTSHGRGFAAGPELERESRVRFLPPVIPSSLPCGSAGPPFSAEGVAAWHPQDHLWLQVRFAGPVYLAVVGLTAVLFGVEVQLDQVSGPRLPPPASPLLLLRLFVLGGKGGGGPRCLTQPLFLPGWVAGRRVDSLSLPLRAADGAAVPRRRCDPLRADRAPRLVALLLPRLLLGRSGRRVGAAGGGGQCDRTVIPERCAASCPTRLRAATAV